MEDLLAFDGQATSGQAFRRAVLEEMLPLPEEFVIGCSDGYLCYNCIFRWPVVAIDEPLTRYRLHGANLFSFDRPDPEKMKVKFDCWKALMRHHAAWLELQGIGPWDPRVAAFRGRQELAAEMIGFALAAPGRLDFFRHLRKECAVYRPLWSRKYRVWKTLSSFASLALGFRSLIAMRKWYQGAVTARRIRAALLPRMKEPRAEDALPSRSLQGRTVV